MQQELDTLNNDRRDLKEKLREATKKNIFENMISRQTSSESMANVPAQSGTVTATDLMQKSFSAMQINDSPALIQEIHMARNINKVLSRNNLQLEKNLTFDLLKSLPKLPLLKDFSNENNSNNNNDKIYHYYKQSNDLLKVNLFIIN